ncbi:unnamed protein product [Fusarium graminearum]|nr:unnamed protein product [Fusarium graminearum]
MILWRTPKKRHRPKHFHCLNSLRNYVALSGATLSRGLAFTKQSTDAVAGVVPLPRLTSYHRNHLLHSASVKNLEM